MNSNLTHSILNRLSPRHARSLARSLGWFSTGLAVLEIVAPRSVERWLDLGSKPLLRFYGVREFSAGVGILRGRKPSPWMWGRVAGDMLDIATLAGGLVTSRRRDRVTLAFAAVAGITALDVLCARALDRHGVDRLE